MSRRGPYARPADKRGGGRSSKRHKRRGSDKELPLKLDLVLPESRIYSQLLKFESRLDATIARKHISIQEALSAEPPDAKILRFFVWSEHYNQTEPDEGMWGGRRGTTGGSVREDPCWVLKLQAQVIEPQTMTASKNPQHTFSNFVRQIVIQLDPAVFPDPQTDSQTSDGKTNASAYPSSTIVWRKDEAVGLVDGLEVKRRGTADCEVKISIWLEQSPERFRLDRNLAKLTGLGGEIATRARVLSALYEYITAQELFERAKPSESSSLTPTAAATSLEVVPNRELAKVLGTEAPFPLTQLQTLITPLLFPPEPLVVRYTVRPTESDEDAVEAYEMSVNCPQNYSPGYHSHLSPLAGLPDPSKDVALLEQKLAEILAAVRRHTRRREFLLTFSGAPAQTITALVNHQAKEITARSDGGAAESYRRGEHFREDWVPDAVDRYLREKADQRLAEAVQAEAL